MEYYFKRDIWTDLLDWKNTSDLTVEVRGARQVGKTFILKKFCKENFKQFFYISMAEDTGKDFLKSIEVWSEKFFRQHDTVNDILELMKTYKPEFEDSANTVVLIDEIQESSRVYNLIRPFTRNLKTKFIVTGSYLGKILDREFFLPAGDLQPLTIYSLSFPEFLGVFGERELQEECCRNLETNEKLANLFELYGKIGGYPKVIIEYLSSGNVNLCNSRLQWIMDNFIAESRRYFTTIEDYSVFYDLMQAIAVSTLREKRGGHLIDGLLKILKSNDVQLSKDATLRAVSWLKESGIIGYASKVINADATSSVSNARYYFQDIGMAGYFAGLSGFNESNVRGFLAENYVYTVIRSRFFKEDRVPFLVPGRQPSFSTYDGGGELDFVLFEKYGEKKIGVEVKAGKGSANTGKKMLKDGKINKLYVLKGNTCCGEVGSIITMPLYLADCIDFGFKEVSWNLPDLRELVKMSNF